MKNFLLLLIVMTCFTGFPQSTDSISSGENYNKLRYSFIGGIGFGTVEHDSAPNYNLNVSQFEFLVNYKFSEKYGVASGFAVSEMSGNGFNENGNFFHDREEFRIPILFTLDYKFTEKIKAIIGLGFYGKTYYTDDYRFLDHIEKDIHEDWNFGFQSNFGIAFAFDKNYSLGLNFSGQSDFLDIEARSGQSITGEQRMENTSVLGLMFLMQF